MFRYVPAKSPGEQGTPSPSFAPPASPIDSQIKVLISNNRSRMLRIWIRTQHRKQWDALVSVSPFCKAREHVVVDGELEGSQGVHSWQWLAVQVGQTHSCNLTESGSNLYRHQWSNLSAPLEERREERRELTKSGLSVTSSMEHQRTNLRTFVILGAYHHLADFCTNSKQPLLDRPL